MNGDDTGRLIYLVLLGTVIASWFFVQNRQSMGKTLQQGALWGLIFVGFVAAFGLWENIKSDHATQSSFQGGDGEIITLVRHRDGHFYAELTISNARLEFLVDTGATDIVLSQTDAQKLGIDVNDLQFFGTANTANGVVKTARVQLADIEFEGIKTPRIAAYVNQGDLNISLLGMSYLSQMSSIEIAGDKMILRR
ncbi:retropepsin-like aspartic protease family protein [Falsihalocynthiibacter arcticus]|uniref:Peptidase A2 domain-containing protein n=1 Tax=Falsihalocynthiibacter arcticus TaxID=1579316 RepID=A0A126V577_9RHOB|nr:TIGR02281 family clan AA aspartic protease [Falsihalocynthiibacter arcticus]AML53125.1 hypothetical protein RC74_19345 [Falsihalocynthiibacter arcticus]